jgi:hypothetical protein
MPNVLTDTKSLHIVWGGGVTASHLRRSHSAPLLLLFFCFLPALWGHSTSNAAAEVSFTTLIPVPPALSHPNALPVAPATAAEASCLRLLRCGPFKLRRRPRRWCGDISGPSQGSNDNFQQL